MSWSLTYRPRLLSQLHLVSVRETLVHLVESGHFPQALLFAGPKGTGKTSAARILAAMLNDPANLAAVESLFLGKNSVKKPVLVDGDPDSLLTKQICLGQSFIVTEIDAASHGSVDDVRALKERASLPPQIGAMTVYILDEVHMMSTQAFNALLKLIEEPPAHSIFILATTELHKVPATIASRCTLVQFKKATKAEILEVFDRICQAEKLIAEPEGLELLADLAEGSFRDAVKWLELTVSDHKITLENVEKLVGINLKSSVEQLILTVIAKDAAKVVEFFESWRAKQVDQIALNRAVFSFLHEELLIGLGAHEIKTAAAKITPPVAQFLLQQLLEANLSQPSPIPHLALEIKLLDIIQKSKSKKSPPPADSGGSGSNPNQEKLVVAKAKDPKLVKLVTKTSEEVSSRGNAELTDPKLAQVLVDRWADFVKLVKAQNSTVATLLKSASLASSPQGSVIASLSYSFHRDQLKQVKFEGLFRSASAEITGQIIPIQFELSAKKPSSDQATEVIESSSLSSMATQALM